MKRTFPGASNPAAVNLLLGTCFHESLGGTYLAQLGGGPARGIYQIEPRTELDIWKTYLTKSRAARRHFMKDLVGYRIHNARPLLTVDLEYQTALCRLVYYRHTFTWPDPEDLPALAEIWKKFFNTKLGAGTQQQFINDFPMEAI